MSKAQEDERQRYDAYLAERRSLVDACFQQSLTYDTTTVTLTGGALALSLTFIKDIVGTHPPCFPITLYGGWTLLIVALLCTLASFQLSVHAYQRQRAIADFEYQNPNLPSDRQNRWTRAVNIANWISLGSIVVGVGLLTIFVAFNTWGK